MSKIKIFLATSITILMISFFSIRQNVSANAWIRMELSRAADLCGAYSIYQVPVLRSGSASVSNGVVLGDLRCTTGTNGRRETNLRNIRRTMEQKLNEANSRSNSRARRLENQVQRRPARTAPTINRTN